MLILTVYMNMWACQGFTEASIMAQLSFEVDASRLVECGFSVSIYARLLFLMWPEDMLFFGLPAILYVVFLYLSYDVEWLLLPLNKFWEEDPEWAHKTSSEMAAGLQV